MNEKLLESFFVTRKIDFEDESLCKAKNCIALRKLFYKNKTIFNYKGITIAFTPKQIKLLKLVSQGFSNTKVAQELQCSESSVRLTIYRLIKYLEVLLLKNIDRYSLIIFAQELLSN